MAETGPLFSHYPMEVEFARYQDHWQRWLVTPHATAESDEVEALIAAACGRKIIVPIELAPDSLFIDCASFGTYEIAVPYEGDDALWNLYPGTSPVSGIDGEIFRGDVMTEFLCADADSARARAEQWVQAIENVLEHQKQRIDAFERSSADRLRKQFRDAKASATLLFPANDLME